MTAHDGMLVRSYYLRDLRQIFNLSNSNNILIVDVFYCPSCGTKTSVICSQYSCSEGGGEDIPSASWFLTEVLSLMSALTENYSALCS